MNGKYKYLYVLLFIVLLVSCKNKERIEVFNAEDFKNENICSISDDFVENALNEDFANIELNDDSTNDELKNNSIMNINLEVISLGNSQYKPNSTKYKNFDIEQFSLEWKLFCVFNIDDISKEDFERVQDVRSDGNNIDFEIIKDDFAIICGLYENFEGNVGQYIAKVDYNKNKVLQINIIDDNSNKIFYIKDYGDYFILAKRLYSLASGIIYYSDISNILPVIYD